VELNVKMGMGIRLKAHNTQFKVFEMWPIRQELGDLTNEHLVDSDKDRVSRVWAKYTSTRFACYEVNWCNVDALLVELDVN